VSFSDNPEFDAQNPGEPEIGNISHDGGDAWQLDDITVIIETDDDETAELTAPNDFEDEVSGGDEIEIEDFEDEDTFEVGNSATVQIKDDNAIQTEQGYELTVIHEPSDSIIFDAEGTTPDN